MPETAVNKDDLSAGHQNDVRMAWQLASVAGGVMSQLPQDLSNEQFGLRVFGVNATHPLAPLF
jgi:hypothetical protein